MLHSEGQILHKKGHFGARSPRYLNETQEKGWKSSLKLLTLPETNIAHENPIFPGENGGFSMAMLVSGRVVIQVHLISQLVSRSIGAPKKVTSLVY